MDDDTRYYLGLSAFPGIGPVRFSLLYSYFGSAKGIWEASESALLSVNLPHTLVSSFMQFRKLFSLEEYERDLQKKHVGVLPNTDPRYPKLLSAIDDAPFLLYVKGTPSFAVTSDGKKILQPINMERTIAVVGTRKPTAYGLAVTETLVKDLVAAGCTIVSGMAYGIDAAAHKTAIRENGKTIAVLGCGVDICAPAANRYIYDRCSRGGCGAVVSEMPLGLRPSKGLFPARNRIVSGLSLAVVVVEGTDESGALITARNAAEQGRDVFAVPGPVTSSMSKGPAKLLKAGAQVAESADDILSSLGLANTVHSGNNKNTDGAAKV